MKRHAMSAARIRAIAEQIRGPSSQHSSRDYGAAVAALNTLQSNFSIVEAIKKLGPGWNKQAIPEMKAWIRRIGYEPSDFDTLNPVHIAGTKGKGSTSSFISSILSQYLPTKCSIHAERLPSSVGLYTSPHLRFVRERIQIDGQPISEDLFAKCFWEIWDRLEASAVDVSSDAPSARNGTGKPVYFHYLTLMALHCYTQQQVGTAVIECGIGGEYDTTNIFTKPSVTGVTSLGIDHQSLLGDTIESIAWHKAGIFKPDVPAFTAPQPDGAFNVLKQRAEESRTTLHVVQPHPALDQIKLDLQGDFQKLNASLAITVAAAHLQRLGFTGVPDPMRLEVTLPEEFVAGLEKAHLGGRCDRRADSKISKLTWNLDGGHTLESIEVAGKWFAAVAAPNATRVLIFNQQTRDASSLARKLHTTLASALGHDRPFAHAIFCKNTTYRDAGCKPDLVSINTSKDDVDSLRVQKDLAATWNDIDSQANVNVVGTIEEAIAKARAVAETGNDVEVLATGSLHLVGGCIEILEAENESK